MLNAPPIQQKPLSDNGFFSPVWVRWLSSVKRLMGIINDDLTVSPPTLADADAANNTIYYSSTASKLVYKDSGGVVRNLY